MEGLYNYSPWSFGLFIFMVDSSDGIKPGTMLLLCTVYVCVRELLVPICELTYQRNMFIEPTGPFGFKNSCSREADQDFARIGRLAALIILNTGLPVPIFGLPLAEFIILGAVRSELVPDDFPPGPAKEMAKKVSVYWD